jgi:hypothetical protein
MHGLADGGCPQGELIALGTVVAAPRHVDRELAPGRLLCIRVSVLVAVRLRLDKRTPPALRTQTVDEYDVSGTPDYLTKVKDGKQVTYATKLTYTGDALIYVKDDDQTAPTLSRALNGGVTTPVSDGESRELRGSVSDTSGVKEVILGYSKTNSSAANATPIWTGDAAIGSYSLNSYAPGVHYFNLQTWDGDNDPIRNRTQAQGWIDGDSTWNTQGLKVTVVDDDSDDPIISFFNGNGVPLPDDSRRESHGLPT